MQLYFCCAEILFSLWVYSCDCVYIFVCEGFCEHMYIGFHWEDIAAGAGGEIANSGLGSPTGSTFSANGATAPYPPVRRANKMSAMQIR